ncbi:MAG: FmdB family zinc ribbon protein [Candidatus Hodarchaeales archaeon]|jgi:putative FmdB family regulatory protein
MPEYEFTCKECKINFSIFISIKEMEEKPEIKCFHCGSDNVERKYSSFYPNTESKS